MPHTPQRHTTPTRTRHRPGPRNAAEPASRSATRSASKRQPRRPTRARVCPPPPHTHTPRVSPPPCHPAALPPARPPARLRRHAPAGSDTDSWLRTIHTRVAPRHAARLSPPHPSPPYSCFPRRGTLGAKPTAHAQDCKFEVCGKKQYTAHKALQKELERDQQKGAQQRRRTMMRANSQLGGGGPGLGHSQTEAELNAERRNSLVSQMGSGRRSSAMLARRNAQEAERSINEAEFKRSIGSVVRYGETIQLRHATTGHFITIKKERAEDERQCLRVQLQADGDEGSWFEIRSGYNTRVQGERVLYGDTVLFANTKFKSQLNVASRLSGMAALFAAAAGEAHGAKAQPGGGASADQGAESPSSGSSSPPKSAKKQWGKLRLARSVMSATKAFSKAGGAFGSPGAQGTGSASASPSRARSVALTSTGAVRRSHAYVEASREINASADGSRFKIRPYANHISLVPNGERLLKGGDTVTVRHRSTDSILVCEGERVEWVTVPATRSSRSAPNSNSLWKVEALAVEWAGTPLTEGSGGYRLKHMATATYLAALPRVPGGRESIHNPSDAPQPDPFSGVPGVASSSRRRRGPAAPNLAAIADNEDEDADLEPGKGAPPEIDEPSSPLRSFIEPDEAGPADVAAGGSGAASRGREESEASATSPLELSMVSEYNEPSSVWRLLRAAALPADEAALAPPLKHGELLLCQSTIGPWLSEAAMLGGDEGGARGGPGGGGSAGMRGEARSSSVVAAERGFTSGRRRGSDSLNDARRESAARRGSDSDSWRKMSVGSGTTEMSQDVSSVNAPRRTARLSTELLDKDGLTLEPVEESAVERLLEERGALWQLESFMQAVSMVPMPEYPSRADHGLGALDEVQAEGAHREYAQGVYSALRSSDFVAVLQAHSGAVGAALARMIDRLMSLRPGQELKVYQSVLREQGLISTVVGVLECIFRGKRVPLWALEKKAAFGRVNLLLLAKLCNRLVVLSIQDNHVNKSYVIANGWMSLFQELLGSEMKSANTIAELYHNNLEQLQRVGDREIETYVTLLAHDKRPRYLNFLGTVCSYESGGALLPLPRNQNRVAQFLLQPGVMRKVLLKPTLSESPAGGVTLILQGRIGGKDVKVDVRTLEATADLLENKDTSECRPEELALLFHVASLKLFKILLMARNRKAANALFGSARELCVEYDTLCLLAFSHGAPYMLRAVCVDLIAVLYVDREPHELRNALDMTRLWTRASDAASADIKRVIVDPFADFPDVRPEPGFMGLRQHVLGALAASNGVVDVSLLGRNAFLNAVLNTATLMVGMGLFGTLQDAAQGLSNASLTSANSKSRKPRASVRMGSFFGAVRKSISGELRVGGGKVEPMAMPPVEEAMATDNGNGGSIPPRVPRSRRRDSSTMASWLANDESKAVSALVAAQSASLASTLPGGGGVGGGADGAAGGQHDIGRLVDVAIELLDGRKDKGLKRGVDRFSSRSRKNRTVMELKLSICNLLLYCFDMRLNMRLSMAFQGFEQWYEAHGASMSSQAILAGGRFIDLGGGGEDNAERGLLGRCLDGLLGRRDSENEELGGVIGMTAAALAAKKEAAVDVFRACFSQPIIGQAVFARDAFRVDDLPNILMVLLDLARYDSTELRAMAFVMMERHIAQRAALARALRGTQVLVLPEVIRAYSQAEVDISELRRQRKWLASDDDVRKRDARATCTAVLERLGAMCRVDASAALQIAGVDVVMTAKTAEKFALMLVNLGAHKMVFDILRIPLKRVPAVISGEPDEPEEPEMRDVFQTAYNFLRDYASHQCAKGLVFKEVGLYQAHMGIRELNVADAIASCLHRSPELASTVPDSLVQAFFNLIVHYGLKPRWLRLLRAMAVVEEPSEGGEAPGGPSERPLRRNQDLIMRCIVEFEAETALLWKNTEGRIERRRLLAARDHTREIGSLAMYHISYVDLLAGCCRGKNPTSELKASGLLSIHEVMSVLLDLEDPIDGEVEDGDLLELELAAAAAAEEEDEGGDAEAGSRHDAVPAQDDATPVAMRARWGAHAAAVAAATASGAVALTRDDEGGNANPSLRISPGAYRLIRASFVRFLHYVYIETAESSVLFAEGDDGDEGEVAGERIRLWPREKLDEWEASFDHPRESRSLFEAFVADIRVAAEETPLPLSSSANLSELDESAAVALALSRYELSARQYVCESVLPAITAFCKKAARYGLAFTDTQDEVMMELTDALEELDRARGMTATHRVACKMCMAALRDGMGAVDQEEAFAVRRRDVLGGDRIEEGENFRALWGEFLTQLCAEQMSVHVNSDGSISGLGERNLVELLVQSGTVPGSKPTVEFLQILADFNSLLQPSRAGVKPLAQGTAARQVLRHSADRGGAGVQRRLLRVMRAALYVDDGSDMPQVTDNVWSAFDCNDPLLYTKDSRDMMCDVQQKYSDIGVTVAALNALIETRERGVQVEAMRLLIALLEGGNVGVQSTIYEHLTTSDGGVPLMRVLAAMMRAATNDAKEYRKAIKRLVYRRASSVSGGGGGRGGGDARSSSLAAMDRSASLGGKRRPTMANGAGGGQGRSKSMANSKRRASAAAGSGAFELDLDELNTSAILSGRTALALRLVQLMSEGHNDEMQRLFASQAAFTNGESVNFTGALVVFLEAIQPAVVDSMSLSMDGLTLSAPVLTSLVMQVCATLLELVQGPCHVNVECVTRSNFFSAAERLLGATRYSGDPGRLLQTDTRPGAVPIVEAHCALKGLLVDIYRALIEGSRRAPGGSIAFRRMTETINFRAMLEESELLRSVCEDRWEGGGPEGIGLSAMRSSSVVRALGRLVQRVRKVVDRDALIEDEEDSEQLAALAEADADRLSALRSEALKYLFLMAELDVVDSAVCGVDDPHKCAHTMCNKRRRVGAHCFRHARQHTLEMADLFERYTSSVEVVYAGTIEKIFFELTDTCRQLARDPKWCERTLAALHGVDDASLRRIRIAYNNPQEKAEDMLDRIVLQLFRMKQDSAIDPGSQPLLARLVEDEMYQRILGAPLYISLAILALLVFFYGEGTRDWSGGHDWRPDLVAAALGWLQVVVTATGLVMLFLKESTIITFIERQRRNDRVEVLLDARTPPAWNSEALLHLTRHYRLWLILLFLAASLAGVLVSPFFHALHLLDFLVHSQAGQEVLQSARVGGPSLARTMSVGICVIFLYACVTFVTFRGFLEGDENRLVDDQSDPLVWRDGESVTGAPTLSTRRLHCSTFYSCVGMHVQQGLQGRLGALFGDPVHEFFPWQQVPDNVEDEPAFQLRSMYIISFMVVWTFLLSNIMTGQIVEAFNKIRANRVENERDLRERCFVCSIERYSFESNKSSTTTGAAAESGMSAFEHHITCEHSPLSYLFFLDALRSIEPTEYNGVEHFVASRALRAARGEGKRTEWIPIGRALQLEEATPPPDELGAGAGAGRDSAAGAAGGVAGGAAALGAAALARLEAALLSVGERLGKLEQAVEAQHGSSDGALSPMRHA